MKGFAAFERPTTQFMGVFYGDVAHGASGACMMCNSELPALYSFSFHCLFVDNHAMQGCFRTSILRFAGWGGGGGADSIPCSELLLLFVGHGRCCTSIHV